MHMVISAVVYAKSKKEALDKATTLFEKLCENQHPFDYFTTFDEKDTQVSGRDRWGKLPIAVKADSKSGKKMIGEGIKATFEEFKMNLNFIKQGLEKFSDEDLFEEISGNIISSLFKHRCHCAGQYEGCSIWLYDNDGAGIKSKHHLKNVLSKWQSLYKGDSNPYKDFDIWVVPADVHY